MARSKLEDFIVKERFGRDNYDVFYKVVRKVDGCTYCMREVDFSRSSRKEQDECLRMSRAYFSVQSDYNITFIDCFLERGKLYVITQYASNGNLQDHIAKQTTRLEEDLIWRFFIQILLGLYHVHKEKMLHREVVISNVFLDDDLNAKLGPAGCLTERNVLSNAMRPGQEYDVYCLAPERLEDKPYTEKCDVWALGVILYECCMQRRPFAAENQPALMLKILRGAYPPVRGYSEDLVHMVKMCLTQAASMRTNTNDLLGTDIVREKAIKLGIDLPDPDPGRLLLKAARLLWHSTQGTAGQGSLVCQHPHPDPLFTKLCLDAPVQKRAQTNTLSCKGPVSTEGGAEGAVGEDDDDEGKAEHQKQQKLTAEAAEEDAEAEEEGAVAEGQVEEEQEEQEEQAKGENKGAVGGNEGHQLPAWQGNLTAGDYHSDEVQTLRDQLAVEGLALRAAKASVLELKQQMEAMHAQLSVAEILRAKHDAELGRMRKQLDEVKSDKVLHVNQLREMLLKETKRHEATKAELRKAQESAKQAQNLLASNQNEVLEQARSLHQEQDNRRKAEGLALAHVKQIQKLRSGLAQEQEANAALSSQVVELKSVVAQKDKANLDLSQQVAELQSQLAHLQQQLSSKQDETCS